MPETFWRPYKRGTVMLSSFLADGEVTGGLVAVHDSRKFHSMGAIIGTNETETVQPGDVVLFDEGRVEYVVDSAGETFGVIGEHWLHDILNLETSSA